MRMPASIYTHYSQAAAWHKTQYEMVFEVLTHGVDPRIEPAGQAE